METLKTINLKQFAQRVHELFEQPDAKVVWFIGAGCSISSNIDGAGKLVEGWLPKLKKRETGDSEDWEAWAAERFPGYDPADPAAHYGAVIDELFDVDRLRQKEVERITSGRDPAVGYALLAQLMTHDAYGTRANVLLTTNFDDLVADALYLTTNQKPLVVVHDSLAPFARASNSRPLIVKLHGDARLAPRNTPGEVNELDAQLAGRVKSLMDHCALVFCGYGGRDQSVASLLDAASADAFPYGVYWVNDHPPGEPVRPQIERHPSFHVDHLDFDELMIEIADVLDIALPSINRWQQLFDQYSRQLKRAAEEAPTADASRAASRLGDTVEAARMANRALDMEVRGDYDGAEDLYQRSLTLDAGNAHNLANYADFLTKHRADHDRAEALFEQALAAEPADTYNLLFYAGFVLRVRGEPEHAEALYRRLLDTDPDHAHALANLASLLLTRGRTQEGLEMVERAESTNETDPALLSELAFYRMVHGPTDSSDDAHAAMRRSLRRGDRSLGWDFTGNLDWARDHRPDDVDLFEAVAAVITEGADPSTLERFPGWQDLAPRADPARGD